MTQSLILAVFLLRDARNTWRQREMSIEFSRRAMLLGGASTLLPLSAISKQAEEANTFQKAQTQLMASGDRKVSLISSGNENFGPLLRTNYPELQNDPIFEKIAPLCALVQTIEGPGIKAYTVCWTAQIQSTVYQTKLFHFRGPNSPGKRGVRIAGVSAARNIVNQGDFHLVSPFFAWSPAYFQSRSSINWNKLLNADSLRRFIAKELPAITNVHMELDGVVFADKKLLGADKSLLVSRLEARSNAEFDEASSVAQLLTLSASDKEIATNLYRKVMAPRPAAAKQTLWYHLARKQYALFLLGNFTSWGRPRFSRVIGRALQHPKMVITRISN
jgi:hypothetical protein